MQGQWLGETTSINPKDEHALVILNLDRRGVSFEGSCYIFEKGANGFGSVLAVSVTIRNEQFTGTGKAVGIADPKLNVIIPLDRPDLLPAGRVFPGAVQVQGRLLSSDEAEFDWSTDVPTHGTGKLRTSSMSRPSTLLARDVAWTEFRDLVSSARPDMVYRGQPDAWRLRTAFHRGGRADTRRFSEHDMPELRRALTGILSFAFPMGDPEANSALMSLAQHHGYPTPLLDWTRSPYVAAYFACREAKQKGAAKPRVYALDLQNLRQAALPAPSVASPNLTVYAIEPLPLFNPRLVPQQSIVTFCNVDDVEAWLRNREKSTNLQLVATYNLLGDPLQILSELRLMGIHAGSMFPGIDGVCQSLAEKNFLATQE